MPIKRLDVARISKGGRSLDLAATTDTGFVWTTRLRLEAGHVNDDTVPEIIGHLGALIANAERWREHSVQLNSVAWSLAEAMGLVEEGQDSREGDLAAETRKACTLIRAALRIHQEHFEYQNEHHDPEVLATWVGRHLDPADEVL